MKVIHTVPSIAEEASGPSYSVTRLCASLIEEGQDVTLAALDWAPIPTPPSFLKTFPLGLGPRRLGRSPAMQKWLSERASSHDVDVVHNHSLWMMPNVYPGRVSVRYQVPLVVSPRGVFAEYAMAIGSKVKRVFWPLVQKPALKAVSLFHATAESEYADIRRLGFRQPVAVVPNGIDTPRHRDVLHDDVRTLLYLGRIHPEKGVDTLLRAWHAVSTRFPEWRLRIVGPDNRGYRPNMKALAAKLGLARVEFIDALYGEAKFDAYRSADLFVLPSPSENFGISVAEALAMGIPAITTKGAPWAELGARQAGWWIDIGADPLAECLEIALTKPRDVLQAMGERGREWMQAEYSWPEVARKMIEAYRWILNGGNKPDWVRVE